MLPAAAEQEGAAELTPEFTDIRKTQGKAWFLTVLCHQHLWERDVVSTSQILCSFSHQSNIHVSIYCFIIISILIIKIIFTSYLV
jgi:hypothetical protein